jgi:hypothetical protein
MQASASFLCVGVERRRTVALYVFARAVQSSYFASKARGWFHFWGSSWEHGDSLLFILSTAQIMYAYVMSPNTLPYGYWKFIVNTGPIPMFILEQVKKNNRGEVWVSVFLVCVLGGSFVSCGKCVCVCPIPVKRTTWIRWLFFFCSVL